MKGARYWATGFRETYFEKYIYFIEDRVQIDGRLFFANGKLINTLIIRGRTVKTRISARALILCLPLLGGAYSKGALIQVFYGIYILQNMFLENP